MNPTRRFTTQQVVVLFVCVELFALGQFHRASGAVFSSVLMDRFDVSATVVGGLVSTMFLATILAQVPFGAALDRRGPKVIVCLCLLIMTMGTILFALAGSYETLLISRILIGVGLAGLGAAAYIIMAQNFVDSDFGYVNGLVMTLGGIGGLLGSFPLAVALERFAWGEVFGAVAVVTLLLIPTVFLAIKPGISDKVRTTSTASEPRYIELLRNSEFIKILVLSTVTFAPATTITGLWGGPYLRDVVGLSSERAGAVLSLFFVAIIIASYLFGILDRNARSRRKLILGAVGLSGCSLLLLASIESPSAPISIGLILAMISLQLFYVPLSSHLQKAVPKNMLGRASSLFLVVSVATIPAMQLTFGVILDIASGAGFSLAGQFRIAFCLMGVTILCCGLVYASSRNIDGAK